MIQGLNDPLLHNIYIYSHPVLLSSQALELLKTKRVKETITNWKKVSKVNKNNKNKETTHNTFIKKEQPSIYRASIANTDMDIINL